MIGREEILKSGGDPNVGGFIRHEGGDRNKHQPDSEPMIYDVGSDHESSFAPLGPCERNRYRLPTFVLKEHRGTPDQNRNIYREFSRRI
jgi:hypothetical protein